MCGEGGGGVGAVCVCVLVYGFTWDKSGMSSIVFFRQKKCMPLC